MRRILSYLKPYISLFLSGILLKFFGAIMELLVPWGMSYMLETIVPLARETDSIQYIFLWGALMLLFAAAAMLSNIIANRRLSLVARNATEKVRLDLFAKIQYINQQDMNRVTKESLISRATTDTYHIHNFFTFCLRIGVRQPILFFGAILIAFFMDAPLTLVMLVAVPPMVLVVWFFVKYGHPLYKKTQTALDHFVRIVREDINGIRVIRSLAKNKEEKSRFNEVNQEVVQRNQKATVVMGTLHPLVTIIFNITSVLIIIAAAYRIHNGQMETATLLAFLTYVTTVVNAILFMSRVIIWYNEFRVSSERVTEILELPDGLPVMDAAENEKAKEGQIVFDQVTFSYGAGHKVFHDVSFTLQKGQVLGIIGSTGSGKSTLGRLLMRYFDPQEGAVYVDGHDVRTYPDDVLKSKFGAVFQNDIIFRDTIRENIRFGRDISDEEVLRAAKAAQAEFVFEYGLDYALDIRGNNISGGQKQRIYLARALAGNPSILLLDDASSALDYSTDARLRKSIAEQYPDTTILIIAQRISSVKNANRILVMEEGTVINQGTHEELLESSEVYRHIYETQMGDAPEINLEKKKNRYMTEEEKEAILSLARTHKDFRTCETYEEVRQKIEEIQRSFGKRKMYRECMDIVHDQTYADHKATKNINKKSVLLRLLRYLLAHPFLLLVAVALTIVSNLLALQVPKLSGAAIDSIGELAGMVNFEAVFHYTLLMLIAVLISGLLTYLLTVVMSVITKKILFKMRLDMFEQLLKLPVAYYDTHAAGDIISKITYDVTTINTSLSGDFVSLASSLVTVIGAFVMMLSIEPKLILIFLVTIPLTIFYTMWITRRTKPLHRARSGKIGIMNGFIEEMISGNRTIHAYNREVFVIKRFSDKNADAVNAYYRVDYMGTLHGPAINFISNLNATLVTIIGGILYMNGHITLGNISSFSLYSKKFSGPIDEVANIISEFQSALAAAERVFRLLDEEAEKPLVEKEQVLSNPTGRVEFKNISFSYVPEKPILQNVSLTAEPGKMVAIVGPTGAGKTTIINLLMRFYDPNEGEILLDGVETKEYTRDSLRQSFAMVLQDTWLFTGTIFENVRYGNPNATREDVERVCKLAHVDSFIRSLPDGYDTVLTDEGTNVSKGQKQLLTIARAMLLDARLLILDEATSNVDTRTEARIQKAMAHLMENKTCLVIAHRLSTIRDADRIIVLQKGMVAESGTHDELMCRENGIYRELYEAQFTRGEAI